MDTLSDKEKLIQWFENQTDPEWSIIRKFWEDLTVKLPTLRIPCTGYNDVEKYKYMCWSEIDVYIDIDFIDGTIDWFVYDRRTLESESSIDPMDNPSDQFIELLKKVCD